MTARQRARPTPRRGVPPWLRSVRVHATRHGRPRSITSTAHETDASAATLGRARRRRRPSDRVRRFGRRRRRRTRSPLRSRPSTSWPRPPSSSLSPPGHAPRRQAPRAALDACDRTMSCGARRRHSPRPDEPRPATATMVAHRPRRTDDSLPTICCSTRRRSYCKCAGRSMPDTEHRSSSAGLQAAYERAVRDRLAV